MSGAGQPAVKGWCPGAYRPMMSGDGLVVRVRPKMGRLLSGQAARVAELALRYGSGVIDLTSRANLQIRGVSEQDHLALLDGLLEADLLDPTPQQEARRNILTTPFWIEGDGTCVLHDALVAGLGTLPALPAKVGLALDTGNQPILREASADFRFERGCDGALILRADGAPTGAVVTQDNAVAALREMAQWFVATGGPEAGRMSRHLKTVSLPSVFRGAHPAAPAQPPDAGPHAQGFMVGTAFGAIEAGDLLQILSDTDAPAIRVTPWRLLLLEAVHGVSAGNFITTPASPLLRVHACPGAPFCPQAQVETRPVARAVAARVTEFGTLHVSGCRKGCALPRAAGITLVGAQGKFDLVRGGAPWEEPETRGISANDIMRDLTV